LPIQDFADWVLMDTLADTISQHSILLVKLVACTTFKRSKVLLIHLVNIICRDYNICRTKDLESALAFTIYGQNKIWLKQYFQKHLANTAFGCDTTLE